MIHTIKFLTLFVAIVTCFITCSDDDIAPIFEDDKDTRVNTLLKAYKDTLIAAPFGWKTVYQPEPNLGGFNIYMDFEENGEVTIISDYNNGVDDLPTTYRVGIEQFPELVFESYSVFHSLFITGGFSLGAEFQFIFEEVTDDEIILRSKSDVGEKSKIIFTKANAQDREAIEASQGLDQRLLKTNLSSTSFVGLTVINEISDAQVFISNFEFNIFTHVLTLAYEVDGNEIIQEIPVVITEDGFEFINPINLGGETFQKFIYSSSENVFTATQNELTAIIQGVALPVYINKDVEDIGNRFNQFLYRPSLGADPRTTEGFNQLINQINQNVAPFGIVFFDFILTTDFEGVSNLLVRFETTEGDLVNIAYILTPEVRDRKIFYEYGGPTDQNSQALESSLIPLLNFWLSTEGLIYSNQGTFQSFINAAGTFINLDNTLLQVYAVWL